MAWRIDEHVIRGEIDNRTRGRVHGRIWFLGREAPVELDLAGNAWRDVAGRRIEFVNPEPKPGLPGTFAPLQAGVVGDITASRKVKVPEIPLEQIGEYYAQRKPWPWHWGNSLYLEWFSAPNGRVVIESASYQLVVSPEIAWEMSPEDEIAQRRINSEAMTNFMARLGDVVGAALDAAQGDKDDDADSPVPPEAAATDPTPDAWDDPAAGRPQTEKEADRMLADSDRLGDRIAARLEREGESADFEKILEEELERRAAERGDPPLTPEQEAERLEWIEEMNRAAAEALDDPEIRELVELKHPLATRAADLATRIFREPEKRGWITADTQREHPVLELINGGTASAAKLAGALNGREWPPTVEDCALTISWLKRARGFLTDALAAADACAEEKLTEAAWLAGVRAEISAIADEVDTLIAELRSRLERGFD